MAQLPTNAHIQLLDGDNVTSGAYYNVKLEWVPRNGELIDLHSSLDARSGHLSKHYGVVVAVVHELYDVSEHNASGGHFVKVFVKPATSPYFG